MSLSELSDVDTIHVIELHYHDNMTGQISLFTPSDDPAQACKNACGVMYEASFLQALEYRDMEMYAHAHNHAIWLTHGVPITEITPVALAGAHAILAESPYTTDQAHHADLAMHLFNAYDNFIPMDHERRETVDRLVELGKSVVTQVKKRERAKRRGDVPDVDMQRVEQWRQDMEFWRYLINVMPLDQTRMVEVPRVEKL